VARDSARLGLALDPLELVGTDDAEGHGATLPMSFHPRGLSPKRF